MAASGTILLDFGAFPGASDATVAVADATILSTSLAEAWIFPVATTDHSVDEHVVEELQVFARDVVQGVGFTIQGTSESMDFVYGKWTVGYVWV